MDPADLRSVKDNRLVSRRSPAIEIEVAPAFRYAGRNEFVLYGVATAEQHLFVAAGPDQTVQRYLWVQFEGYLESNSHTYDYSASRQIELSGWPFAYDAGWMDRPAYRSKRPDSDGAQMAAFLEQQGYHLGGVEVLERYVTLSPDLRQELMLIYSENAESLGLDWDTLESGGESGEPWLSLLPALHGRAVASFRLTHAGAPFGW